MATKKRARPTPPQPRQPSNLGFEAHVTQTLEAQDRMLEKLDQRLDQSPVLNGGFETLLVKVEKIESIQEELATTAAKVDAIHTAIYDPEKGLYSRLKDAVKWIDRANWVIKGLLALAATGGLTAIGKVAYDLLTGHIHYAP